MTHSLIYHDIARPDEVDGIGFPGPLAARYKLTPERFEQHLEAIVATGAAVGLAGEDGTRPGCAITFDDGGSSALVAAEMLERRGWRGHFFITTGRMGTPGFLEPEGVRELAARGHAVGSHSHSHPTYMGHLGRGEIAEEWRRSREELAAVLGAPPATASVPGGFLSDAVVEEAASAGYRVLFTSEPTSREAAQGAAAVLGRYTIWSTTPARQAAGYARGSRLVRGRLAAEWRVKKAAKTVSPAAYQALRRIRAVRR